MKVYKIDGYYSTWFVCAESWVQAIEVFKRNYYPALKYDYDEETKKYLLEQQKKMDISFDKDSEWTISECDISHPNFLGGHEG